MPVFTTACPRNCYSTCSMVVTVQDGRLVRIESHPDNLATPQAVCLKGQSYVERLFSPKRLLVPLRRKSGTTEFIPVSWDEALDLITEKLLHYQEAFGPQSVLYYAGSGTKGLMNRVGAEFWRLYGGCTTTYGDLCWPAGLEATRLTLGDNKHNVPWDIQNARLILLWGKNPAETNIHQMRLIDLALERGARLIVIDPRRTPSAERAERLIQPRPGTDGALALGVAYYLIREELLDREFIDHYVLGFPEFSQMVQEYPPERVEEITGVPSSQVEYLAEAVGSVRPLTLCAGFGLQRYTNGGQTIRSLIALLALTGNLGRPGAGWAYANLQSHIFDPIRDPLASYPPEGNSRSDRSIDDRGFRTSICAARLGRDMLSQQDPPLKMIWVERGNPVCQNPETGLVLKAFRALEFRVVVDQFLTDTAHEADLILPAKSMFEQSDVVDAYWHSYIQLKQKIFDPPGQVKPESEVYYLLARRLGYSEADLEGRIPGPSDQSVEAYLQKHLEPFPELTLKRLAQGPVLAPGTQEIAFSDLIFPTPSGKVELLSQEARERWGLDPLPRYTPPLESQARNQSASHRNPQSQILNPHSSISNLQSSIYPLHLLTPNTQNGLHSQFLNLELIRQLDENILSGTPWLSIHPEDARQRGIRNGDLVRIYNGRGELVLRARLSYRIRQGCLSTPNGYSVRDGGTVNFLTAGLETDMGHGAAYHDNLVDVELLHGSAWKRQKTDSAGDGEA